MHALEWTCRAARNSDDIGTAAALAHWQLIQKRESLELPLEQIPGFEQTEIPPPPSPGNGGIKGTRLSKKDKLRALAAAQATPK